MRDAQFDLSHTTAYGLDEFCQVIARCATEAEVLAITGEYFLARGFGYSTFAPATPSEMAVPDVLKLPNAHPEWAVTFGNNGLHRHDPTLPRALATGTPIRFLSMEQEPRLKPLQIDFLQVLRSSRLTDGLTLPVYGRGARNGWFILGDEAYPGLSEHSDVVGLHAAAQFAYSRMDQISARHERATAFSGREREVLFWMAAGKSTTDLATIIGVSPATAATYVKRIFLKLDVNNRVAATIAAMQLGLV